MVNGINAEISFFQATAYASIFGRDVRIDPVRGTESGASLPAYERKLPTRRGEQK